MFICGRILFIFIISIFSRSEAFSFNDCYFDGITKHVEYVCGVADGINFGRRTWESLYCNNHSSAIDRGVIEVVSFRGCESKDFHLDSYTPKFASIRMLNVSSCEILNFRISNSAYYVFMENIIASHNQITEMKQDIFDRTPILTTLDFSYNKITKLHPHVFDAARKLKSINFSFNMIQVLENGLFDKLDDLEYLNFNNNEIKNLDGNLFVHNRKLTSLHIKNNQVNHLSCALLSNLAELHLLTISLNTLENFQAICVIDNKRINLNITIASNESTSSLNITDNQFQWTFAKDDFTKIRSLNISNSQIVNISSILQETSVQLEELDLSNTTMDEMDLSKFQRFLNLKKLNLSHTNLSSFQFATFYHQKSLEALDLSYNSLNNIDFHLFVRNFLSLVWLNLKGNKLTELDTMTRTIFPKLSVLGVSRNNFSCEYLGTFLHPWKHLSLIGTRSNQTQIGGVDCLHEQGPKATADDVEENKAIIVKLKQYEPPYQSQSNQHELFTIQILLGLILFLLLFLILLSSKFKNSLKTIKGRLLHRREEDRHVTYNQNHSVGVEQTLLCEMSAI